MMKQATKWDVFEYLTTEADMTAYLNAALEDGDTSIIAAVHKDIAQAETTQPSYPECASD